MSVLILCHRQAFSLMVTYTSNFYCEIHLRYLYFCLFIHSFIYCFSSLLKWLFISKEWSKPRSTTLTYVETYMLSTSPLWPLEKRKIFHFLYHWVVTLEMNDNDKNKNLFLPVSFFCVTIPLKNSERPLRENPVYSELCVLSWKGRSNILPSVSTTARLNMLCFL